MGFVFVHMLGNLLLYQGPEAINQYGRELRLLLHGSALWIARATLLASVVIHIAAAWSLTLDNRAARPVGYAKFTPKDSTYASRTMRWSGVIVLLFVVYHLLHFTFGNVHPDFIEGDVFHKSLAIEQGAFFEGKSRRSEDPMSVQRAATGLPPPAAA